jgi:hypothetical protein
VAVSASLTSASNLPRFGGVLIGGDMGWFSVICIAIFAIICGRYAYKHESFEHLFAGKQFDRVLSVMFFASLVAFVFAAIGASDEGTKHSTFFQEYCKVIKNGYICKFPEEHEQYEDESPCNRNLGRYSDC